MYYNSLLIIDFLFEDFFLQFLLLTTSFFLITTQSLIRKLWGFTFILIILGLILANLGYELYISFLWLIELSFIIVFLLLIMSFNLSIKLNDNNNFFLNFRFLFLFFVISIIFFFILPIYFYISNYYSIIKGESFLNLISFIYYIDYYKENQPNSIILSDIKGLGLHFFNNYYLSLFIFLLLLTFASIFIVIIQLICSLKKNLGNKLMISKIILNKLKYNINKNFINKEILEYQLKSHNGLRIITNKKIINKNL